MVFLNRAVTDKSVESPIVGGVEKFKFELQDENQLLASVYGSHYAALDLPKNEMPEREMPKEVAYRLIK